MRQNKKARLESDLWECILILPNCNQTQMNIRNYKTLKICQTELTSKIVCAFRVLFKSAMEIKANYCCKHFYMFLKYMYNVLLIDILLIFV